MDKPQRGIRVSDLAISLIRTWVPIAVVAALAWFAVHTGVVLSDQISAGAAVWATAGGTAGYYAIGRWLERRTGPGRVTTAARWLGRWMLGGVIRQPVYANPNEQVAVVGTGLAGGPG